MDLIRRLLIILYITIALADARNHKDGFYNGHKSQVTGHHNILGGKPRDDYSRPRRQDFSDSDVAIRDYDYGKMIGPVHTFVKTDEHAHFKWGVRHYVG